MSTACVFTFIGISANQVVKVNDFQFQEDLTDTHILCFCVYVLFITTVFYGELVTTKSAMHFLIMKRVF